VAGYDEHIKQSLSNLSFLGDVNRSFSERYDWQVTIAFYTAVHLVNAHLAKTHNLHFRSHEDVKNAISPTNATSVCRIDETPYLAYDKLCNCSRRARYLICDNLAVRDTTAFFTNEKYFAKAMRNLDTVITYFANKHSIAFPITNIKCARLMNGEKLNYFKIVP